MGHLNTLVSLLPDELLQIWQMLGDMFRVFPHMLLGALLSPLCLSYTIALVKVMLTVLCSNWAQARVEICNEQGSATNYNGQAFTNSKVL